MADERDQGKFNLRLPPGMRDEIAATAKANGRSMNAEMIVRLQRPYLDLSDEGIIAVLKRIEATALALEELYFKQRDEAAKAKKRPRKTAGAHPPR